MLTKAKTRSRLLLPLDDEQIATRRPPAVESGPAVAARVRGGGLCWTEKACEDAGGAWKWHESGGYYCDGSDCVDSGSGDWDA